MCFVLSPWDIPARHFGALKNVISPDMQMGFIIFKKKKKKKGGRKNAESQEPFALYKSFFYLISRLADGVSEWVKPDELRDTTAVEREKRLTQPKKISYADRRVVH